MGIRIEDRGLGLGIWIEDELWGFGLEIGILHCDERLRFEIWIGDCMLGIGIEDQEYELGIEIGNKDWGLELKLVYTLKITF